MKAQAFTVFKMMIAAVLAVALLAIVYQMLQGVSPPYTGFEAVRELVIQASNAPGECFQRDRIVFQKDEEISEEGLKYNTGVSSIQLYDSHQVFERLGSNVYRAKTRLEIPVKVQCSLPSSCKVYFAEECP